VRRLVAVTVPLVLGLVASGCGGGGSDLSTAVADIADDYLAPAYASSSETVAELSASATTACDDPGTSLDGPREAWKIAETTWIATQAGWFGPTTVDRADSKIGYQPTSESGIEETLASELQIDAAFVRDSLPTTQKGMGAIEYILFSETPLDARRCEYLVAVSTVAAEDSEALDTAWNETWKGDIAYADYFKGLGEMGPAPREALGLSTAGIVELTKKLTLEQIGKALGITSPEPHPEAYPEGQARFGLAALRAQIQGIADSYGEEPGSMSGAVASRDSGVDAVIRGALTDALVQVDAIIVSSGSLSFAEALETNHGDLEDLYELLATLRRTFETDVVSLLDVTLGFSDSDGDSG
jgi:uncharacterized protein